MKKEINAHIKHGEWKLITRGKRSGNFRCTCGKIVNDWKPIRPTTS